MPTISVVINTFNGAEVLPRAVASVLAQDLVDVEVIVADDGSAEPPDELLRRKFPDAELVVVSQPNAGLSAARNLGAARASGAFVVFLDDDDELCAGALNALRSVLNDEVGIASGAVEVVEVGAETAPWMRYPKDLGAEMDHAIGCNLAGSFAIAADVLTAVGGFDEDLHCNHQRDLFMRAVPWCTQAGRPVVHVDTPLLRMHRKPSAQRPRNDPARLQRCLEHLLVKHADRYALNPTEWASVRATAGVAAARQGDLATARSHLRAALAVKPTDPRGYLRLLTAYIPPLARRTWHG